jgi:hypothetical protein
MAMVSKRAWKYCAKNIYRHLLLREPRRAPTRCPHSVPLLNQSANWMRNHFKASGLSDVV